MLKFIEKIGRVLLSYEERMLELRELKIEFVRNRKAILRHIYLCKKSGGVIGLYSSRLGAGMFLVTITRIKGDIITVRPVEGSDDFQLMSLPIAEIYCI